MTPYERLPAGNFWRLAISGQPLEAIEYDLGRKFSFEPDDRFATAGSCFARHFGRELTSRGGVVVQAERPHPLAGIENEDSYGSYSARYGNIYTLRQLLELLAQATGDRPMIEDFVLRDDGRFGDMMRPGATPEGFSTYQEAYRDRRHHLACVRQMLQEMTVFVFTLGLTEAWINVESDYAYPVCPGSMLGMFDETLHRFVNFSFEACRKDLIQACETIHRENPNARVLLTVSPVMLVATAENRNVLNSSIASKSILRAVVDSCVREFDYVDYFSSYEIITGPQAQGQFWESGGRNVKPEGVRLVMDTFFKSRIPKLAAENRDNSLAQTNLDTKSNAQSITQQVEEMLDDECEEIFLDPGNSRAG